MQKKVVLIVNVRIDKLPSGGFFYIGEYMISAGTILMITAMLYLLMWNIRKRRATAKWPNIITYYKWGIITCSGFDWYEEKLCWKAFKKDGCETIEVDIQPGDKTEWGIVSDISSYHDGDQTQYKIFIGKRGETNIDVFNAKRASLIEDIVNGVDISQETRELYNLG